MGEDITATRSFCNMKISILIASLALIYATASPIDNVVPEESLIDNEYIHPDDEAHATAQRKVNELLQSGKSDADCRKLAKSTADDVIKSVAAQQAALNKMGRGSQCNVEGSSLIAAAEKSKSTAESNLKSKTTAHTNAKAKKFNFGDFSYNTLTEGQCGTFFNSAVWKSAKASVAAAKSAIDKAQGEVAQAKKDLADAKATAAKMVATCKCNVKKLHAKTITDFNNSVNAANMKAWKLAAHLVCVLDHKTTNQCTVPTLPTVKAVTLDAGVSTACAQTTKGYPKIAGLPANTDTKGVEGKTQYAGEIEKLGLCKVNDWTDEESQCKSTIPGSNLFGSGKCRTGRSKNVGIWVTYPDGTDGYAVYSGVQNHWCKKGNFNINPSYVGGMMKNCNGLHFLTDNSCKSLPMAWAGCVTKYSNNFDLDRNPQKCSDFRASKSGWKKMRVRLYCDCAAVQRL